MPDYSLKTEQCLSLIQSERIARFAFKADDEIYLIPLGYVWFEGALCGMTDAGRKTQIAAINSRVTFQLDDSAERGPFGWRSVTGEGDFEIVIDQPTISRMAPVILEKFSDAPNWAMSELGAKVEQGKAVFFKVNLRSIAGRAFTESPPD